MEAMIFKVLPEDAPYRLCRNLHPSDIFGGVEDLAAHKARIGELEARKERYARFPSAWAHGNLHIGTITSGGAALITFAKAAGEVPVHPPDTAVQRLIEYFLRQEVANAA